MGGNKVLVTGGGGERAAASQRPNDQRGDKKSLHTGSNHAKHAPMTLVGICQVKGMKTTAWEEGRAALEGLWDWWGSMRGGDMDIRDGGVVAEEGREGPDNSQRPSLSHKPGHPDALRPSVDTCLCRDILQMK